MSCPPQGNAAREGPSAHGAQRLRRGQGEGRGPRTHGDVDRDQAPCLEHQGGPCSPSEHARARNGHDALDGGPSERHSPRSPPTAGGPPRDRQAAPAEGLERPVRGDDPSTSALLPLTLLTDLVHGLRATSTSTLWRLGPRAPGLRTKAAALSRGGARARTQGCWQEARAAEDTPSRSRGEGSGALAARERARGRERERAAPGAGQGC